MTETRRFIIKLPVTLLFVAGVLSFSPSYTFPGQSAATQGAPTDQERAALLEHVIANQKKDDAALFLYERIERLEIQKGTDARQPAEVKTVRAVPAGTGIDRIAVGPDGKPMDATAYRAELEKLEKSLMWAAEEGRPQREAYDKVAKKQKERADLIDSTRNAFLYTF